MIVIICKVYSWMNILPCTQKFSQYVYTSRLSMEPGFSRLKFCGRRLSKSFRSLLHGYKQTIYPTISSEIDKAP